MSKWFVRLADVAAEKTGTPKVFVSFCALIIAWFISGPLFHWSTTWQLIINTPTTVVTVAQLILVAHRQDRDAKAFHAKLDAIITGLEGAPNALRRVEEKSIQEIEEARRGNE